MRNIHACVLRAKGRSHVRRNVGILFPLTSYSLSLWPLISSLCCCCCCFVFFFWCFVHFVASCFTPFSLVLFHPLYTFFGCSFGLFHIKMNLMRLCSMDTRWMTSKCRQIKVTISNQRRKKNTPPTANSSDYAGAKNTQRHTTKSPLVRFLQFVIGLH